MRPRYVPKKIKELVGTQVKYGKSKTTGVITLVFHDPYYGWAVEIQWDNGNVSSELVSTLERNI